MSKPRECWVVTDGRAGIENQALGLAEAVARETDLVITKKRIAVSNPWRSLPRILWGNPFSKLASDGALINPPFPDLWIGCGRLSVPLTLALKKQSPDTFTTQLQNPRAPLQGFDLVIPPDHDDVSAENVFSILGSPTRLTAAKLGAEAGALVPLISHLPKPRVAVLIGGSNGANKVDIAQTEQLIKMLDQTLEQGTGLMITTSRRTPASIMNALAKYDRNDHVFLWTGQSQDSSANPYIGMLGAADHLIVTEDSVNMTTEAAMTGRPVHLYRWDGDAQLHSRDKFGKFHAALESQGIVRFYSGQLDDWSYAPLNETQRAASELLKRWDAALTRKLHATFAAN